MPRTRLLPAWLLPAILLAAAPEAAHAQANVVTPAPPPREGTVGPEQLRDFSLPGTRQSPPAETVPVPAPAQGQAQPAPARTAPPAGAPARRAESVALPDATPAPSPAPTRPPTAPADQVTVGLGAPQPAPAPAPGFTPAPEQLPQPLPSTAAPATDSGSSFTWWPWLAAAFAAVLGLLWFLGQGRRRRALAGEPEPAFDTAPEPAPAPPPAEPPLPSGLVTTRLRSPAAPPPAPEPPRPVGGVISTGLRPWIDLDLEVGEVVIGDTEVVLRFQLALVNGGTAPARSIAVEALALNAGDDQGAELAKFYARPESSETGIDGLPPMGAQGLSHEVRMPRAAIREYEAQGRRLFVPVLAFNASYRWGSGSGRTGGAFLVGLSRRGSDRLAPLRLDLAAKRITGLGVRRLEEAVRR